MANALEIGQAAERKAADYLERQGYRILRQNYHSRYGEIDIIAELGGRIIFVEVKERKSRRFGSPKEAVDLRKQEKIKKTALEYFAELGEELYSRFDVIEVVGEELTHLENAFD